KGPAYPLTAPDGSRDLIGADGIFEHITATGQRLYIGDNGITAQTGQMLQFLHDQQGRIVAVKAPDGREMHYLYPRAGPLAQGVGQTAGVIARYGYRADNSGILTAAVHAQGGVAFPADNPKGVALTADLGGVAQFGGHPVSSNMARAGTHLYAFSISDAELRSTNAR